MRDGALLPTHSAYHGMHSHGIISLYTASLWCHGKRWGPGGWVCRRAGWFGGRDGSAEVDDKVKLAGGVVCGNSWMVACFVVVIWDKQHEDALSRIKFTSMPSGELNKKGR